MQLKIEVQLQIELPIKRRDAPALIFVDVAGHDRQKISPAAEAEIDVVSNRRKLKRDGAIQTFGFDVDDGVIAASDDRRIARRMRAGIDEVVAEMERADGLAEKIDVAILCAGQDLKQVPAAREKLGGL